jgi:hypothetical protein
VVNGGCGAGEERWFCLAVGSVGGCDRIDPFSVPWPTPARCGGVVAGGRRQLFLANCPATNLTDPRGHICARRSGGLALRCGQWVHWVPFVHPSAVEAALPACVCPPTSVDDYRPFVVKPTHSNTHASFLFFPFFFLLSTRSSSSPLWFKMSSTSTVTTTMSPTSDDEWDVYKVSSHQTVCCGSAGAHEFLFFQAAWVQSVHTPLRVPLLGRPLPCIPGATVKKHPNGED